MQDDACWRLTLLRWPDQRRRGAFVGFVRRELGLSQGEALVMWDRLPFTLRLAVPDEARLQGLQDRLKEVGVPFRLQPLSDHVVRCERHPGLATEGNCPRCQRNPVCAACLDLGQSVECADCRRVRLARTIFRRLRIAVLLLILVAVASATYLGNRRIASWHKPLTVAIVPVRTPGAPDVERYLASLKVEAMRDVAAFMDREARRYHAAPEGALTLILARPIDETPPDPPAQADRTTLNVALWSLKLRWWSWRVSVLSFLPDADVHIYARFHPSTPGSALEHSLGMQKGRIGVLHLFASDKDRRTNNIVIAHEILHTVGASDKYDQDELPVFPQGFADATDPPRYPQTQAEIMAGRIPLSPSKSKMPDSLDSCVVGPETAREIGWEK